GIAEVRESLRRVAHDGATVLVSSHILAEIEKLVDRILAIEAGRIVFDGPLKDLVARAAEQAVTYTISARDQAALLTALEDLGYVPNARGGGEVEVSVPADDAEFLIERLTTKGVRVLSASKDEDDL